MSEIWQKKYFVLKEELHTPVNEDWDFIFKILLDGYLTTILTSIFISGRIEGLGQTLMQLWLINSFINMNMIKQ